MRKLFKDFIHRSGVLFVGFEKVVSVGLLVILVRKYFPAKNSLNFLNISSTAVIN